MELKLFVGKLGNILNKYRYAVLVVVFGLAILLLPVKDKKKQSVIMGNDITKESLAIEQQALENILQSIHGAGNVKVLLSVASGEETRYQNDTDISESENGNTKQSETVLTTDSQRMESGLICQVNPPIYKGAIVVCEGADNAEVKLAITQAVSKITGLSTDHICVLKME